MIQRVLPFPMQKTFLEKDVEAFTIWYSDTDPGYHSLHTLQFFAGGSGHTGADTSYMDALLRCTGL